MSHVVKSTTKQSTADSRMITLYGIKNCDTVRKALRWLDEHNIPYLFHDLRKDGLSADTLQGWIDQIGWQPLLNTRSTTWRQLGRALPDNAATAHQLMLEHPTLIKRPVLNNHGTLAIGFTPAHYQQYICE